MTSFCREFCRFTTTGNGFLGFPNRRGGFKGSPEDNIFPITETALDAAGIVAPRANFPGFIGIKGIIVFTTEE